MNNLEKITGQTMEELKKEQVLIILEEDLKEFPKEICKLTNLTHLQVIGCNLTKLPKEIGKLKNLTYLDLSHNKLTELPKEIGKLKNLEELVLTNNPLKELPMEIINLKYLFSVDLIETDLPSMFIKEFNDKLNPDTIVLYSQRKQKDIKKELQTETLLNDMDKLKLLDYLEKNSGVAKEKIHQLVVAKTFSFVSVRAEEAAIILKAFQGKKNGKRNMVEIAQEDMKKSFKKNKKK